MRVKPPPGLGTVAGPGRAGGIISSRGARHLPQELAPPKSHRLCNRAFSPRPAERAARVGLYELALRQPPLSSEERQLQGLQVVPRSKGNIGLQ